MEKRKTYYTVGNINWDSHYGEQHAAAAAAKLLQSSLTLCNPIDGSAPGSAIPGILQARTLEWVAISFSNAWKWKVKVKSLSRVQLSATPWTAAYQAPPSMGFSRQEYWRGVPLPSPADDTRTRKMIRSLMNKKQFDSCNSRIRTHTKGSWGLQILRRKS